MKDRRCKCWLGNVNPLAGVCDKEFVPNKDGECTNHVDGFYCAHRKRCHQNKKPEPEIVTRTMNIRVLREEVSVGHVVSGASETVWRDTLQQKCLNENGEACWEDVPVYFCRDIKTKPKETP